MEKHRPQRRVSGATAELTAGTFRGWVEIRNVSRTGMRIVGGPDNVPPGALVRLRTGPVIVTGQVKWRMDDKMGIALTQPMTGATARRFSL